MKRLQKRLQQRLARSLSEWREQLQNESASEVKEREFWDRYFKDPRHVAPGSELDDVEQRVADTLYDKRQWLAYMNRSPDLLDVLVADVAAEIERFVAGLVDRPLRSAVLESQRLADQWPLHPHHAASHNASLLTPLQRVRVLLGDVEGRAGRVKDNPMLWTWPSNVSPDDVAEALERVAADDDARVMAQAVRQGLWNRADDGRLQASAGWTVRVRVADAAEATALPAALCDVLAGSGVDSVMAVPIERSRASSRWPLHVVLLVVSVANEVRAARAAHVHVSTDVLAGLLAIRSGADVREHKPAPRNHDTFTVGDLRTLPLQRVGFVVEPRGRFRQMQLFLPLDGYDERRAPFAAVRRFLTDWDLRAYLGLFALPAPDAEGLFWLDSSPFLLDVLGRKPRMMKRDRVGLPPYARPQDDDEKKLRLAVEKFQSIVFTRIGAEVLDTPQRLVERVTGTENLHTGRRGELFRHNQIVWDLAKRRYVQMPRAAMQLSTEQTALAAGIALYLRDTALGFGVNWLDTGKGVTMSLADLARAAGEPVEERVRRDGRAWWTKVRGQLDVVVARGGFGKLHVGAGDHGEQQITLAPSDVLATVYAPLLQQRDDKIDWQSDVEREAEVRNLLPPAPKGTGRRRRPFTSPT
jgi:hypothetical protein